MTIKLSPSDAALVMARVRAASDYSTRLTVAEVLERYREAKLDYLIDNHITAEPGFVPEVVR